ncbi:hypothetical protein BJP36_40155 [Moorena producens JHB]|uniref:Uncharacterized protein n=1 Tax=Moorena producens (strain JHB) TaxID=1454205 RepID=A0A9Q9SS38_MOOP1|nr:hypothetical protein [Moorena producens]WAN68591.1 hypothetical protein BJP36_40155 [Moorena producens JHB]
MPLASCLLPLACSLLPIASMPIAFPSWEGLGVGSSCLLPIASCLLPSPPGRG